MRASLGARLGVDPAGLVLGNGASELLWTLARVLQCGDGARPALVVEPAFSGAFEAAHAHGDAPRTIRVDSPRQLDTPAFLRAVRAHNPSFVYLAHPTSPRGRIWSIDELRNLIESTEPVPWVLDESFLSLSTAHADRDVTLPPTALRVRSLGKALGLAGVRAAYAVVSPAVATRVRASRPPWTVGSHALAMVDWAAQDDGWAAWSRRTLLGLMRTFASQLERVGFRLEPTESVYGVIEVGDARSVTERLLLDHGIAARDCTSFGLPRHLRVCARPEPETARFAAALAEVCG